MLVYYLLSIGKYFKALKSKLLSTHDLPSPIKDFKPSSGVHFIVELVYYLIVARLFNL